MPRTASAEEDWRGGGPGVAGPGGWRRWRGALLHAGRRMSSHRVSLIAAGVAFYALLALFPALAALVAIYGLAFDPQEVTNQVAGLGGFLPPEALDIVLRQLQGLTQSSRTALSYGAVVALVLALWSASRGVKTLMEALNFAYNEEERRGFFSLNGTALLLTLAVIVGAGLAVAAVVAVPVVINVMGLGSLLAGILSYVRWPVLALGMVMGLGILYRYGPCRTRTRPSWFSAGAIIATLLWLGGSWAFSFYVQSFGKFNETYGSVGAVVILLTWFLLSAYVILVGAEIDAALEERSGLQRAVEGGATR